MYLIVTVGVAPTATCGCKAVCLNHVYKKKKKKPYHLYFWKRRHATPKNALLKCIKSVDSWGFALNPNNVLEDKLYSWIWLRSKFGMCSFSANSSTHPWEKINFRLNSSTIHQIALLQVWIFKIFRGGAHRTLSPNPSLPRSISGFAFDSGFDLKYRALCALGLSFTLDLHQCVWSFPQTRGTRWNI